MKAILGLGNPGLRYKLSRHNLGFLVIDNLAKTNRIRLGQAGPQCLLGQGRLGNFRVILAKPLTFVNLSGQAAFWVIRQHKIKLKDLLIICDDVHLALGKIRIRPQGSCGGHQGLLSIIRTLGSSDFARLRIGLGRTNPAQQGELSDYVLGRFNKREMKVINRALEEAAACCQVWVEQGIDLAMNEYN